jgi:hypothetical protein
MSLRKYYIEFGSNSEDNIRYPKLNGQSVRFLYVLGHVTDDKGIKIPRTRSEQNGARARARTRTHAYAHTEF